MKVMRNLKQLDEELEIEEQIKSGKDIEIIEAIDILKMIKNNISFEEISVKTGKTVSDIAKIKTIFNA